MSDASIGERLREAREAKGLSFAEVEKAIHIRAKILAALEAEDFVAFASLTQARGLLRNYAQFLGLEADELLARPMPAPKARPAPPPAPTPKPAARPAPPPPRPKREAQLDPRAVIPKPSVRSRLARLFSADIWIAVIVTILMIVLLVWGGSQLLPMAASATKTPSAVTSSPATNSSETQTSGTPIATPLIATATLPPASPTEAPLPTPRPNYVGVNILVRAEQRIWLRVLVDGVEIYVGQMPPGATREFQGQQAVELWTGNGKGTRVVFNGQDQGTLGEFGDVAIRIWTLDGMVTPTPTASPIP